MKIKILYLWATNNSVHFQGLLFQRFVKITNPAFLVALVSFGLAGCQSNDADNIYQGPVVDEGLLYTLPDEPISYFKQVKPVLESRCVTCHACYDAPCQLKLTSIEGMMRGANKEKVYNGTRIFGAQPTRLSIDATTTEQWREKEFYSVLNEGEKTPRENLEQSTLYQLLRLKELHPQARVGTLSNNFDLDLDRKQFCPKPTEVQEYTNENPQWGMPYAMPNLSKQEYKTLVQWLAQGSPVESRPEASPITLEQVTQWEEFLNGSSNKEKLVSRYIYEHLFQAHIHFSNTPNRTFYRLVRSTTAPGELVSEIPTTRPLDDPGTESFYYRLRPYNDSIVAKSHMVYEFSPEKMDRYRELFFNSDYEVESLPSYEQKLSANPFKVFEAIPPTARYQFLLDDARYFVEGFIKGPVCRGQIAINVIEDQFWVFFFAPDSNLDTINPEFLAKISNDLAMPSELGNTLNLLTAKARYGEKVDAYTMAKTERFREKGEHYNIEDVMQGIWDGGGTNPNAALTIFRHFDSASIEFGLAGDYPETAWILDYPILERIHYLLVASFDVYGNVGHQLNTRLYMDFLRMEGEDYFLGILPASHRRAIQDSWYVGMRDDGVRKSADNWLEMETVVGYTTDDPQLELYQRLEQHLGPMAGPKDNLNRCASPDCSAAIASEAKPLPGKSESPSLLVEQRVDSAMAKVAKINGEILQVFPDLTFVRIRNNSRQEGFAYTLIRNKSYQNISSMFSNAGDDRRDAANDTLTVMKGLRGSYPNFFFDIELEQVDNFAERYAAIESIPDYELFVELFGVRRTDPDFWEIADWFQDFSKKEAPIISGLFDLNRYENR